MFVCKKKYDVLLKENESLRETLDKLTKDYFELTRQLNEAKQKDEPSYFG